MGFAKYAFDFGPQVINMFNSMTTVTIAEGIAVMRDTVVSNLPDPGNESNVTRPVLGIRTASVIGTVTGTADSGNWFMKNVVGIALQAIPASTWGPVCIGGPCKVVTTASCTTTLLTPLTLVGTLGRAISAAAPFEDSLVVAIESATIPAAGTINVFYEPAPLHPMGYGVASAI